jgi:hypothetical protein
MNLLEAYISAVVDSILLEDGSNAFSIDQLRSFQDLSQILGYIQATVGVAKIGEGQGRLVYKLGDGTVLKVAKDENGQVQNQTEAESCGSNGNEDLFPEVRESDPDGKWLISEEAAPMTRVLFRQLTGMGWGDFVSALAGAFPHKLNKEKTSEGSIQHNRNSFEAQYSNLFFRKIISVIKDCKYEPGDISKLDSWGIINGKPVIIDSGFAEK